ncbi:MULTISPECIES: hypothetical protein [Psychrilyobacter]|uniref:hypothetical protein n=1 Tax=Psychrilyobacter TaxID=623282 RepID=UPI00131406E1|nr:MULTISPECIES: hypothetical protein [Psychrilyobacter]NDI76378.1 hypothetical protein [Psychrilyobacter piezotolerans]
MNLAGEGSIGLILGGIAGMTLFLLTLEIVFNHINKSKKAKNSGNFNNIEIITK